MSPRDGLAGPLVTADWLSENLDDVAVADVRWSLDDGPKRQDYATAHIPGAVFVDLDQDLSDPPGARGRHPLPSVSRFRQTLRRLGLENRPIVCYDDRSGSTAARLWWMLRAIDIPSAVLDGGIGTWPGPWTAGVEATGNSEVASASNDDVVDSSWPSNHVAAVDEIVGDLDGGAVLVDARSHDRFIGKPNSIDSRAGHIPGARSRPWTENIGDDGRFLPPEVLRKRFDEIGVGADSSSWMNSCGSGVTACHNLLAAAVAGLPIGRLYVGSWSEWTADRSRPVAVERD